MKKHNGRRKRHGPRTKRRKGASVPAPARAEPVLAATPTPAPRCTAGTSRLRDRIDWPALAILALPLALMALLQDPRIAPSSDVAPSAVGHRGVVRVPTPPQRDAATRTARVPIETLEPWQGDLAREVMPFQPDAATRTAPVRIETQEPWHGDLAREVMPLLPESTNQVRNAPPTATLLSRQVCVPEEQAAPVSMPPASFGRAIAAAARAQTGSFVIYNARYVHMSYPGGDTHPLYGVCTDVIIRAYRALGIDLQELIHTSRLGRGDPSIDHRRVEVVRRFLTRHGTSLPISDFAEDYRPGDIVTYHRPEGRISQSHIAIVSDEVAPSGRPLIVHNRGWGPQLEDALFVDHITGHYRLTRAQVEVFMRTRAPRVSDRRRRTAGLSGTSRR